MHTLKKYTGLLVGIFCVLVVLFTYKDYGTSADEPAYYASAAPNAQWILHPSLAFIDNYWNINDHHPPLMKISGGLASYLFADTLHLTDFMAGYRLGTLPFVFLLSFMMTSITTVYYGAAIGIFAGITSIFLPRLFYEAHLGALDFSIAVMAFAAVATTARAARSWKWFIASLIFIGLALSAKLQGIFFYGMIGLFWTLQFRNIKLLLLRMLGLVLIPPAIFLFSWPWLWPEPLARYQFYLSLMQTHIPIEVFYLGTTYMNTPEGLAPWHYPFVLTLVTLPVIVLILFLFGVLSALVAPKKNERLFLVGAFLPLMVSALPQALKYDGVRLFLPAFPFIVFLAAAGLSRLASLFVRYQTKTAIAVSAFTLLWVIASTLRVHPFQMSYYNELVGGLPGAVKAGFETEYWATPYANVLGFVNAHGKDSFCVFPWPDHFERYKLLGKIPQDLTIISKDVSYKDSLTMCTYLILLSRQGFFYVNPDYLRLYRTEKPVYSVTLDGVPLVSIYKLR